MFSRLRFDQLTLKPLAALSWEMNLLCSLKLRTVYHETPDRSNNPVSLRLSNGFKDNTFPLPDLPTPLLPKVKNLASAGIREFICDSLTCPQRI